jgi:uncharacterized iron-regulated membrane protein
MKEATLRRYHRYLGVSIALLVVFQVGTGLLLSLNALIGSNALDTVLTFIHFGDGVIGNVYRIVLGATLLFMVVTGAWIYLKMLARSAGAPPKRAAAPAARTVAPEERVAAPR